MSLIADRDYCLQLVRLSYARHVSLARTPLSVAPGTGPLNVVLFDTRDVDDDNEAGNATTTNSYSPYVALAGLADKREWPELETLNRQRVELAEAQERLTQHAHLSGRHRRRSRAASLSTAHPSVAAAMMSSATTVGQRRTRQDSRTSSAGGGAGVPPSNASSSRFDTLAPALDGDDGAGEGGADGGEGRAGTAAESSAQAAAREHRERTAQQEEDGQAGGEREATQQHGGRAGKLGKKRKGGPGPLRHTATIVPTGKAAGTGAGMRVSGFKSGWKGMRSRLKGVGKNAAAAEETTAHQDELAKADEPESSDAHLDTSTGSRRSSLEASIHRRRMSNKVGGSNGLLPPVVVTSPAIKSPALQSPARSPAAPSPIAPLSPDPRVLGAYDEEDGDDSSVPSPFATEQTGATAAMSKHAPTGKDSPLVQAGSLPAFPRTLTSSSSSEADEDENVALEEEGGEEEDDGATGNYTSGYSSSGTGISPRPPGPASVLDRTLARGEQRLHRPRALSSATNASSTTSAGGGVRTGLPVRFADEGGSGESLDQPPPPRPRERRTISSSSLRSGDGYLAQEESAPGTSSAAVSLFGTSTRNGQRERSDSDASLAALPSAGERGVVTPTTPSGTTPAPGTSDMGEDPVLVTAPPLAAPPKSSRAFRERRRVNVSGRVLLPISEPTTEDEASRATPPTARPRARTVGGSGPRLRLSLGDETETPQPRRVDELSGSPHLVRKWSAPSALSSPSPSRQNSRPTSPTTQQQFLTTPSASPRSSMKRRGRSHHEPLTFSKRPIEGNAAKGSALTAMLAEMDKSSARTNAFSTLYGALISRAPDALTLGIYFPRSSEPGKKLKLTVRRDVTVEEVIGAALWAYTEEDREPPIDVGEDENLETTKWNLRIVEDDGEVDEDFPALDRGRALSAFSFNEFALVEATPAQRQENASKQTQIVRRPSRTLAMPKTTLTERSAAPQRPADSPMFAADQNERLGTVPVTLRVKLEPTIGTELSLTVPSDTYFADVLDEVCRKRSLANSKDWALVVSHANHEIVVPLDRTVESLGDHRALELVRRSAISAVYNRYRASSSLQNTNPSTSIFKNAVDSSAPRYKAASDLAMSHAYKSWRVYRKLPIGRHDRELIVDGDTIHMCTVNSRGADAGRTTSYNVAQIVECRVSRRAPNAFKIVFQPAKLLKRYDFEADSAQVANEIVAQIHTAQSNAAGFAAGL